MKKKSTRLEKAEAEYESQLHEWLTNPKNEDLSPELTEEKLSAAFQRFLDELLADEAEELLSARRELIAYMTSCLHP